MARRTGAVGRLARLAVAALLSLAFATIVDQGGPSSFRDASNATEPITLVLQAAMLLAFVMLTGQLGAIAGGPPAVRRWRICALAALGVAAAAAAATALLTSGELWASPLVELVWGFDAVMLVETIVALVLAAVLGTSGCEVGVWADLFARARGRRVTTGGPRCPIGLHLVDEWEAGRGRV
jgi:hypothetical protein